VPTNRTLLAVAGVVGLFTLLVAGILVLLATRVITFQLGLLMLVALLALYLGFGVLIAVWRFVSRLN
jgi:hypothetical protein